MKHTKRSLESLTDRFIFAAHFQLSDAIVAMTDELTAAQDQVKEITGQDWVAYVIAREDILSN